MKQIIIVRKDLKMSCGKIAGQVAHASVRAQQVAGYFNRRKWFKEGETKVVLKVKSLEELLKASKVAHQSGFKVVGVHDLGKTQIPEGTLTTIGIGPYEDVLLDELFGELKLL